MQKMPSIAWMASLKALLPRQRIETQIARCLVNRVVLKALLPRQRIENCAEVVLLQRQR